MSKLNIKIDYTPLEGGIDTRTSALAVKPGRLIQGQNFEQVFGKQGYRRVDGYGRYDGRPEPHLATYSVQAFTGGTVAITVGQTVTGASTSGYVLAITLASGTWGAGTAAGEIILGEVTGSFVNAENIKVGGSTVAVASGTTILGSIAQTNDTAYRVLAQSRRRSLITAVTGSGPILGVAVYNGDVYAFRDAVDGKSATMWKSSASGWTSVRTGLYPGGDYSLEVCNFTGSSATAALFGCDGKNRPFKWDGTTFTQMAPIFGTQATSTTSTVIGTGSKTLSILQTARSWTIGSALTLWSSSNAANRMNGVVTGYTHPSVTINITSIEGSGTITDWEIGRVDFQDKPYLLTAHKNHMFLGYPMGQLQTSNIGDPMTYTTSAALFAMGDELTGLASLKGETLVVFCKGKISLLSGSSVTDWQLNPHSDSAGAKLKSLRENVGNAIFWDGRGLTTLQATLTYGNFEPSIFSSDVNDVLSAYTSKLSASMLMKVKYQYRLYMDDGYMLCGSIQSPNPQFQSGEVSFLPQKRTHIASCTATGDIATETDAVFFGTTDGYVMHEDVGTSFDGELIYAILRTHFNQYKSPSTKKRFRKLVVEMESQDAVDINFRQGFDFIDGFYPGSVTQTSSSVGEGGVWDASSWDTFRWSGPLATQAVSNVSGFGKSMSLLMWHQSATDKPFILQGLLTHYSPYGVER